MSRDALIELLHRRLGLDPKVLGERVLDDAFGEARRALRLDGDAALYARAIADPAGFAEVIEHFVVPETWFFRVPEQYRDLVHFARTVVPPRQPLRVLSLPCASGEEAYSAAMALLDAGFAPDQIDVLGIDVSPRQVEYALKGVYRRHAVRGDPLQTPWVSAQGDTFAIDPMVKRCVRFRVGNALDQGAFQAGERFDAVFCRNLLIYLHEAARTQLLRVLGSVLTPPALVLAGQAEVLPGMAAGFAPFTGASPLSYLFRGPDSDEVRNTAPATGAPSIRPATPRKRPATVISPVVRGAPERAAEPPPANVEEARRLADLGKLDEARQLCAILLERKPQDIEALYLLGSIESARGDLAAADNAFARVLYLDGDHADALEHRIALAEQQGHAAEVRTLRARAHRLRQRGRSTT